AEVHMVEEVEELGAELHRVRFVEAEILMGREIDLVQAGQVNRLAGGVSELAERRLDEGGGVEPAVARALAATQVSFLSGDHGGPRFASCAGGIPHARQGGAETGLLRYVGTQPPAAEQHPHRPAGGLIEQRDVIERRDRQPVTYVEDGWRAAAAQIEVVLDSI